MQNAGKLYYSIKEVAEQFGINASQLRFYEKKFPSLSIKKNKSGERTYTQADIDHIREIFDLVDTKGLKLAGAREHLKQKPSRQDANQQHIQKLEKLKTFLTELRDSL